MHFNLLRTAVEIRCETKDKSRNKTYVEVFFGEIIEYSYLGESNILECVTINQILELDEYIESGRSKMFKRTFRGSDIPPALMFYINHIAKIKR